jgi:hypothetical protein
VQGHVGVLLQAFAEVRLHVRIVVRNQLSRLSACGHVSPIAASVRLTDLLTAGARHRSRPSDIACEMK